jgi:hypothetical protein
VPANVKNFFNRAKAHFSTKASSDIAGLVLTKNVTPISQKYLKMYVKEFKKVFQTRRKPKDEKNLQETLDRWQTLAGINKRIL